MEDIVKFVLAEKGVHAGLAADAGDNGLALDVGEFPGHHQTNVMLRRLSLVDKYHEFRLVYSNLTYHF